MKIVVVSDTHMPRMAKRLPSRLVRELGTADLILHAGDWTSEQTYEMLARYAPVEGVAGNNDGEALVSKFGYRKIILCEKLKIGLVHGHGTNARRTAERQAALSFGPDEVDAIVFGHSHVPVQKKENGVLLFNPGSPTDKRRQKLYSFGVLEIEGEGLKARHVYYENKE
ncbi:metallophosphoesterase family protein [Cohnella caldifontis]|uniref:metallophosphoesterase family protein n=1 Tax=Cohnella caldifontis TaxID=3027471 RepID=UPI0023EB242B|nr:metallophosphoesterase [Cohnella sp. YIM B05605]